MKKYRAILFDADETLLDFKKSEQHAFYQTAAHWNLECDDRLLQQYSTSNKEAWSLYEQGVFGKDRLTIYRFEKFFEREGLSFDPYEWNAYYKECLGDTGFLLEGANKLIDFSRQNFEIYIVTNGISSVQHNRLEKANIKHLFSKIFISEELGFQKPRPEYFNAVFSDIPYSKNEVLLIGDSLTSDIAGGIGYGIDTCFVNWSGVTPDLKPTYMVSNLKETLDLLKQVRCDK